LGHRHRKPNKKFVLPPGIKITKVRACFTREKKWFKKASHLLVEIEFYDSEGNLIY